MGTNSIDPSPDRIVLFVCIENTFRSVMSQAIFNAHAPTGWRAESAGVRPAEAINPIAVELLGEIGIQVNTRTPRLVTAEMISRAWRLVTFGCLDSCPIGAKEKSEDWPIPGSTNKTWDELRTIREELLSRILKLIDRLPKGPDH